MDPRPISWAGMGAIRNTIDSTIGAHLPNGILVEIEAIASRR
ncbi:MAG: hypothetical protein ACRDGH_04095 [Candidatus Limnocylindria bacterium]